MYFGTYEGKIHWIDRIPGYSYYDTPEGEDCIKKVIYMNKLGLFFGIAAGSIEATSLRRPTGFGNLAFRYFQLSWPIMAVGSTFAAVTCLATNFRQKDDTYNYSLGGCAAGLVAGAAVRSGVVGTVCAVSFAIAGYIKKLHIEHGIPVFPESHQKPNSFGGIWSVHYDLSLTKEGERGWKTSED